MQAKTHDQITILIYKKGPSPSFDKGFRSATFNKLRYACPCKIHPAYNAPGIGSAARFLNKNYKNIEAARKEVFMMLLTQDIRKTLPPLYSQEDETNPLVRVKFFLPASKWTWYGIEFDGEDLFFGYVDGDCPELGYFRLSELQEIRGLWDLGVERDMYFKPTPLHAIQAEVEHRGE